jgi:DNA helicase IV
MAMRQTDSEPPVEESAAEETAESHAESDAESAPEAIPATGYAAAVRTEQAYVTMLYGLLDQARERSERQLASVRAQGGAGGTHQARLERDVSSAEHEKRITQLNLTERGLCFGRVDDEQRQTLYIGRIGLRDDDYDLKLIDWRAPAARPF